MSEPTVEPNVEEGIDLPDGSSLPPYYRPGDIDSEPLHPTPPPPGRSWEDPGWDEGL